MHINTLYDLAGRQVMVFQISSPDGLDSRLSGWQTFWLQQTGLLTILPASAHQGRLHTLLTHVCTNTLAEHRDTIERDLWAQSVCFNGQKRQPISPLAVDL